MTEATNETAVGTNEEVVRPDNENDEPEKMDTEFGFLEKEKFTGDKTKGFEFFYPQFETSEVGLTKMKNYFTKNNSGGKDGATIVVSLINSTLKSRVRAIANGRLLEEGKLMGEAKLAAKLAKSSILYTEEEASTYSPGDKDAESISGYNRKLTEIKKNFSAAKQAGNTEKAKELALKFKETKACLDDLIAKQAKADEESMAEFLG